MTAMDLIIQLLTALVFLVVMAAVGFLLGGATGAARLVLIGAVVAAISAYVDMRRVRRTDRDRAPRGG